MNISACIAEELGVREGQVQAAVALIDEGSTVPFIARYRKEATGSLDDTKLRALEERLRYLRELEERRAVILRKIREQGKLTEELQAEIEKASTKTRLEDLYLPYKPRRRTKGQVAREAGIEPLADSLFASHELVPYEEAARYVNAEAGFPDPESVLGGARYILMERFAEDADLLGRLREVVWNEGHIVSKVVEGKQEAGAKFSDYFDFSEPLKRLPSHRALALFRGRNEGILQLKAVLPAEAESAKDKPLTRCEGIVARHFGIEDLGRAADGWLLDTVRSAWRIKIFTHLEVDSMMRVREAAEEKAIKVFAENLHDLLLAAPAGPRITMGLDPGLRTGVKVAIIDATGRLVDHGTVYPHPPRGEWEASIEKIAEWARAHAVDLVSIGNGTASRETDRLVTDVIHRHPELKLKKAVVNEAGASVYSASELAAREFPDLDVSMRGAVSIARRLQDPLAELVKIEPRSIGVGQYQHDVSQSRLSRCLDAVVEDCVNAVGVDVNTASVALLSRVSGLNRTLAQNIVDYRDQHAAFPSRKALLEVPRMGEKSFEQAAGFLRIINGENPLDASAVHPEAYPVVQRIADRTGKNVKALIGDAAFLRSLRPEDFTDDEFGVPTVADIIRELEKPGRDPRPEFVTAEFKEGVEKLEDLAVDMVLEGSVTNVTNFGAFVDVGVHQDGLVHISELSDRFVKDPREVVKAGDVVKVRVLEVDLKRQRISLTMRLGAPTGDQDGRVKTVRQPRRRKRKRPPPAAAAAASSSAPPAAREKRPARPVKREPPTLMSRLLDEALAKAKKK
ncbi:MAG: RNA-binding transcriptional accessory protein [Planctomycetes bacterium]|nr:RNA-binding transcriptional accessory protein [Planctomycetota bacterium]